MIQISVVLVFEKLDEGLIDSIKSILNQSFKDFELILIDDCSIGDSKKFLNIFKDTSKIKLFINKKKLGLTKSLNKAIKLSNSDLIARIDSGDISYKDRLKTQFNFLNKHKKVDVLGAQVKFIDKQKKKIFQSNYPLNHSHIIENINYSNPFCHPIVMIRKSFLIELNGYNEKYLYRQDYDLWLRGQFNYRYQNLDQVLGSYLYHQRKSILKIFYSIKIYIENGIRLKNIKYIFISILRLVLSHFFRYLGLK